MTLRRKNSNKKLECFGKGQCQHSEDLGRSSQIPGLHVSSYGKKEDQNEKANTSFAVNN